MYYLALKITCYVIGPCICGRYVRQLSSVQRSQQRSAAGAACKGRTCQRRVLRACSVGRLDQENKYKLRRKTKAGRMCYLVRYTNFFCVVNSTSLSPSGSKYVALLPGLLFDLRVVYYD